MKDYHSETLNIRLDKGLQPFRSKLKSAQLLKSLRVLRSSLNHSGPLPMIQSCQCYNCVDSRNSTLKTKYVKAPRQLASQNL